MHWSTPRASRFAAPQVHSGPSAKSRWIVLLAICTGAFMANVDTTAVAVALPTMADEFDIGLDTLQWVVSAYLLTITAVLPTFAKLGDIVGRKPILCTGLLVFVLASGLVAVAPPFELVIAARALQGVGGAMFMATSIATAVSTFPGAQRGQVLGVVSSTVAAGTVLGPAVGGILTEVFGWRSIFLINLPIGLAGFVAIALWLPRSRPGGASLRRFDLVGAFSFAAFAACLLLALSRGPGSGWLNPATLLLLSGSAAALAAFVVRERSAAEPLVDLRLFFRRIFGLGSLAGFLCYLLTMFPAILFPLYLQEVLGWSTGTTGAVMTVQAVTMLFVAPMAGAWSDRRGPRRSSVVALALVVVAQAATLLLGEQPAPWLVCSLLALFGVAFGLFITPNNAALTGDVSHADLGAANGIIATVRNGGRAVGVAAVVTLYHLFAGTAETTAATPDVLVDGFRGAFAAGTLLACAALAVVAAMYRRPTART